MAGLQFPRDSRSSPTTEPESCCMCVCRYERGSKAEPEASLVKMGGFALPEW